MLLPLYVFTELVDEGLADPEGEPAAEHDSPGNSGQWPSGAAGVCRDSPSTPAGPAPGGMGKSTPTGSFPGGPTVKGEKHTACMDTPTLAHMHGS